MKLAAILAGGAALATTLALTSSALAQENREDVLYGQHRSLESPQNFAIELRFAPFTPAIDSDPSLHGATPFADILHDHARLLFGGEFDWQAIRIPHLGTLGPGVGIGYTKMSALADFTTPHNLPGGGTTLTSGETTSLEIYPFYAVAVLRADVIMRELHAPIVPYAKFGIGYSIGARRTRWARPRSTASAASAAASARSWQSGSRSI